MYQRMDMQNDPSIGYPLMALCFVFGWINQMTKDEITFIITLISGAAAIVSFGVRSYRDLKEMQAKKRKEQDETVVDKPE